MIFLYRFDIHQADGLATDPRSAASNNHWTRQTHLLTNFERNLDFHNVEPFRANFLPAMGTAGLQDWLRKWVFLPERIEHEGLRLDGEKASGQLRVSLPPGHPVSQLFVDEPSADQVWLTLATLVDEADRAPLVVWTGDVRSAEYNEHRCTLTLAHLNELLKRPGLTAAHPRTCPHALYDRMTCRVNANAVTQEAVINDSYFTHREDGYLGEVEADGVTVRVPEAGNRPDSFFAHGFVVIGGDYSYGDEFFPRSRGRAPYSSQGFVLNGGLRRSIVSHTGDQLELASPLLKQLQPGTRVSLFRGCDGARSTCASAFNNVKLFGGYPYIPIKNPFEAGIY